MSHYINILIWTGLILTLFNGVSQGAPPLKIIGGTSASIAQWPSIVSLQLNNLHHCGGTLISKCLVLTAAHCFDDGTRIDQMKVAMGSANQKLFQKFYDIQSFEPHPFYQGKLTWYRNDLGIVTLKECVVEAPTQKIATILPQYLGGNIVGTVLGWGYTKPDAMFTSQSLTMLQTITLTNDECIKWLGGSIIHNEQLCTKNALNFGFCGGDSGGPLFINGQLVGIVSLSHCGNRMPDVYTRLSFFEPWIKYKILLSEKTRV